MAGESAREKAGYDLRVSLQLYREVCSPAKDRSLADLVEKRLGEECKGKAKRSESAGCPRGSMHEMFPSSRFSADH